MKATRRTAAARAAATTSPHEEPADDQLAVDGFTWGEIRQMATDSVVPARCIYCQAEKEVEPYARGCDCEECGGAETISSPLVKLGLI